MPTLPVLRWSRIEPASKKYGNQLDKPFSTNMMKLMQFCAFSATKQNLEKLVATPSI